LKKEGKENSIRKRVLTSKEAKNIEENIITNQVLKNVDFLGKQLIILQGKTNTNAGHTEKYDIMLMNAKIGRITSSLRCWEA